MVSYGRGELANQRDRGESRNEGDQSEDGGDGGRLEVRMGVKGTKDGSEDATGGDTSPCQARMETFPTTDRLYVDLCGRGRGSGRLSWPHFQYAVNFWIGMQIRN